MADGKVRLFLTEDETTSGILLEHLRKKIPLARDAFSNAVPLPPQENEYLDRKSWYVECNDSWLQYRRSWEDAQNCVDDWNEGFEAAQRVAKQKVLDDLLAQCQPTGRRKSFDPTSLLGRFASRTARDEWRKLGVKPGKTHTFPVPSESGEFAGRQTFEPAEAERVIVDSLHALWKRECDGKTESKRQLESALDSALWALRRRKEEVGF